MTKLTKLLAGTAVGGVLFFGAIAPASADIEAQADASVDTAVADADASADLKVGG